MPPCFASPSPKIYSAYEQGRPPPDGPRYPSSFSRAERERDPRLRAPVRPRADDFFPDSNHDQGQGRERRDSYDSDNRSRSSKSWSESEKQNQSASRNPPSSVSFSIPKPSASNKCTDKVDGRASEFERRRGSAGVLGSPRESESGGDPRQLRIKTRAADDHRSPDSKSNGTLSGSASRKSRDEPLASKAPLVRSPVNFNDASSSASIPMDLSPDGSGPGDIVMQDGGRPGGVNEEQRELQAIVESFMDGIKKSVVGITVLQMKKDGNLKQVEVWKKWLDKHGSVDKLPKGDLQEKSLVEAELKKIEDEIVRHEETLRMRGRELMAGITLSSARKHENSSTKSQEELLSRIHNLEQDNAHLKGRLRLDDAIIEKHTARLEAIEARQREQSQSMVDRSELANLQAHEERFAEISARHLQLEAMSKSKEMENNMVSLREDLTAFETRTWEEMGNNIASLREDFTCFETRTREELENNVASQREDLTAFEARTREDHKTLKNELSRQEGLGNQINVVDDRLTRFDSQFENYKGVATRSMQTVKDEVCGSQARLKRDIAKQFQESTSVSTEIARRLDTLESSRAALEPSIKQIRDGFTEQLATLIEVLDGKVKEVEKTLQDAQVTASNLADERQSERENQLQSQLVSIKRDLEELTQGKAAAVSNAETRVELLNNRLQALEESMTESKSDAGGSTRPSKDHRRSSTSDTQRSTGWEVIEGRAAARDEALSSTEILTVRTELTKHWNFIQSHEQRLANFTLEPFMKSIVHHIGTMHPGHPDHVLRSVDAIRSNNQQLTSSVAEIHGTVQRMQTAIREKTASAEETSARLSYLNQIKQDVESLKGELGHLSTRVEDHAQQTGERVTSVIADTDAVRTALKDLEHHIAKDSKANGEALTIEATAPQKVNQNDVDSTNSFTSRLDELTSKVEENTRATELRFKQVKAKLEGLRLKSIHVIEAMKEEHEGDIVKLAADTELLQGTSGQVLGWIQSDGKELVKIVRELQDQLLPSKLRNGRVGHVEAKAASGSLQNGDSLDSRGPVQPSEHQHTDHGSTLRRPAKRKRGLSNTANDPEGQEGST